MTYNGIERIFFREDELAAMKSTFTLSKKELELMELFWDADCPLSRSEILERAEHRVCTWKPNSVHILVNSLLDKGALRVAGYYLNSRKLGRTFEPSLSKKGYLLQILQGDAEEALAQGVSPQEIQKAVKDAIKS